MRAIEHSDKYRECGSMRVITRQQEVLCVSVICHVCPDGIKTQLSCMCVRLYHSLNSKQDTFSHPKYVPLLHTYQPLK